MVVTCVCDIQPAPRGREKGARLAKGSAGALAIRKGARARAAARQRGHLASGAHRYNAHVQVRGVDCEGVRVHCHANWLQQLRSSAYAVHPAGRAAASKGGHAPVAGRLRAQPRHGAGSGGRAGRGEGWRAARAKVGDGALREVERAGACSAGVARGRRAGQRLRGERRAVVALGAQRGHAKGGGRAEKSAGARHVGGRGRGGREGRGAGQRRGATRGAGRRKRRDSGRGAARGGANR